MVMMNLCKDNNYDVVMNICKDNNDGVEYK